MTARAPRRSLAENLFRRLRSRASRKTIDARWLETAALLALTPESRSFVERIFRPSADTNLAEMRFTACIVIGAGAEQGGADGVRWVLPLIVGYLERARVDPRHSTFACGCLLGVEWPAKEAVPILRRLARRARFPAGRNAALHGLEHRLQRMGRGTERPAVKTGRVRYHSAVSVRSPPAPSPRGRSP